MRGSIEQAIPMTEAKFGLLTAVFLFVYALLSPLAGYLADRFSRSQLIIFSLIAWSAVTWLTGLATTYPELLLTRALMGVSEAFYLPAALALICDFHRDRTRALANGIHLSGVMIGSALGGVGGWLAQNQSWAYAFKLFGLFGIGYSLVLIRFLKESDMGIEAPDAGVSSAQPERFNGTLQILLSDRTFLTTAVYWAMLSVAGWGVLGWMPTYLNEQFHLDQGRAGLSATGYINVSALLGMIIGGAWSDWWSRTNPRARIWVPMIGLCVAAPAIFIVAYTSVVAMALLGLIFYGLARAFADANMMPILCLMFDRRCRATGYGVLNFVGCIVGGITIYLGGILRDHDVRVSLIFAAAAVAITGCVVLLLAMKPRNYGDADQFQRIHSG